MKYKFSDNEINMIFRMVNSSGGTSLTDEEEVKIGKLQARFPGQSIEKLAARQIEEKSSV